MPARRSVLVALCAAACLVIPSGANAATASFPAESLTDSDPDQVDRLNQTGPSDCTTPKSAPPVNGDGGVRESDQFLFQNTNAFPMCVTVRIATACTGAAHIHSTAYAGSQPPPDLRTGFLGDRGGLGPSYSFMAPANSYFVVTVAEGFAGGACASYDLTVDLPFAPNVAEVDDGIAGTEPSQSGYLYSASVAPTTCAAPSPTPERKFESDQFRYDAYTYTNTGAEPTCVTATGVARGCASLDVQSAVYLDSFDPANILTNYLASQYRPSYGHYVYPYSFMVPAGRTFVVVVHQRSVGAVCPQYHLSVDGAGVVAGKPDPGPGPGGGDTTPPVFESARISNPTFAIDRTGTAEVAIARAPKGTTFVTRLSEAARVEYVIQARRKGRKVGGRCRKPSAKNRRRKACTRFVAQGAFASDAVAGANSKRFSGKIGDKTLRRGRYRATLTAIDAAGNRSKPKRLNFRVVRR